jgi:hypothetical protein
MDFFPTAKGERAYLYLSKFVDTFVYILIDAFTLFYFSLNLKYMRFNFEIEHIVKRWNHISNLVEYLRVLGSWLFTKKFLTNV